MNSKENENTEFLEIIANSLLLIEEHLGNISNYMSCISEQLEENNTKAIKQLSYISQNIANII